MRRPSPDLRLIKRSFEHVRRAFESHLAAAFAAAVAPGGGPRLVPGAPVLAPPAIAVDRRRLLLELCRDVRRPVQGS